MIYTKRNFFEYSNKNSKLLARIAQTKRSKNTIGVIKDETGKICSLKNSFKIYIKLIVH